MHIILTRVKGTFNAFDTGIILVIGFPFSSVSSFVNVGVIASDSVKGDFEGNAMLIESGEFHQLKGVRGEGLVGCFEYEGKTALYVVNYSTAKAGDVIIDLNDTHEMNVIQRGKAATATAQHLSIHLEAGEGALVTFA